MSSFLLISFPIYTFDTSLCYNYIKIVMYTGRGTWNSFHFLIWIFHLLSQAIIVVDGIFEEIFFISQLFDYERVNELHSETENLVFAGRKKTVIIYYSWRIVRKKRNETPADYNTQAVDAERFQSFLRLFR